jgi:hypothetical protein
VDTRPLRYDDEIVLSEITSQAMLRKSSGLYLYSCTQMSSRWMCPSEAMQARRKFTSVLSACVRTRHTEPRTSLTKRC